MITFTESARDKVREFIAGAGTDCTGLRIRASKVGKHTFRYQLQLVRPQDSEPGDVTYAAEGFDVHVDPQTAQWMEGSTIDFLTNESGAGFQISNPASEPSWDDPVARKVQQVIDDQVLPALAGHGGWVELDRVEGNTAFVRLGGGCQGCASASFTLKQGIESMILREVTELKQVVDETDHAGGSSPYYAG